MMKFARTGLLGVWFGSAVGGLAVPAAAQAQSEAPPAVPAPAPAAPSDEVSDPVPPQTSRVEFGVGGHAIYAVFYPPEDSQPLDGHAGSGGGYLAATVFLRRLVDDGTPLSLQPFLQRVGGVHVSAYGSGYKSQLDRSGELLFEGRGASGGGGLSLDAYVRRFLALTASFSAQYATVSSYTADSAAGLPMNTSGTTVAMSSALGVGLRVADTRIDLGYSVALNSFDGGAFTVPFWGGATAAVRTVIKQYVDLSLGVSVIDQGASGNVAFALYPDNNLSLFASVGYAHGILYTRVTTPQDRVFGSIGGSMWLSRRVAAILSYAPAWTGGSSATLDHLFKLDVLLRT